jgi:hypothetical protein
LLKERKLIYHNRLYVSAIDADPGRMKCWMFSFGAESFSCSLDIAVFDKKRYLTKNSAVLDWIGSGSVADP